MAIYTQNLTLLGSLTRNSELLNLFKQTCFLIHRNTYGGISKHDMQSLSVIKEKLKGLLDKPEIKHLTQLIDSLSLYDLPDVVNGDVAAKLIEQDIFRFISEQKPADLIDILVEHLPKNNGLLLSIPINNHANKLVDELISFTRDNPPDKITEIHLKPCNVWQLMKDTNGLEDNCIHIAFITHNDEEASFLCYKGLCMAQKYLEELDDQKNAVEVVIKERVKKPFMPVFNHGIVTLARKITGKAVNSEVVTFKDVVEEDKPKRGLKSFLTKPSKNMQVVGTIEYQENEVIIAGAGAGAAAILSDDDTNNIKAHQKNMINNKGRGFMDVEQPFLFNIT